MPGAVDEILPEAGLLDVTAHRTVHFPAGDRPAGGHGFLHSLNAGVTRLPHDIENLTHAIGGSLPDETRPGDVVVDGAGCILLRPHVEQDKTAFADGRRIFRARLVVGITAVCIHRHDRRIFGYQVFAAEGFHEPLLDAVLICAAVAHPPPDLLEGCGGNGVNGVACREMRLDLLLRPSRFELRYQIAGTDHVLAQAANQFECTAIHQ